MELETKMKTKTKTTTYAGTIVTRDRTSGYTDAFSMSGYDWAGLVRSLKGRGEYTDLVCFMGVAITDNSHVETLHYTADELKELTV